jgi:hypothetical protein
MSFDFRLKTQLAEESAIVLRQSLEAMLHRKVGREGAPSVDVAPRDCDKHRNTSFDRFCNKRPKTAAFRLRFTELVHDKQIWTADQLFASSLHGPEELGDVQPAAARTRPAIL